MRRLGLGEAAQAFKKTRRRGEPPSVKLWVAAGKPAKITILGRQLIGERRKEGDFRARFSPARQNMRIDK